VFEKQEFEDGPILGASYAFVNGCVAYYVTVCCYVDDHYMAKMFPVDFAGGIACGCLRQVFGNA